MIFNGPNFLLRPRVTWQKTVAGSSHNPWWLISASLTAAVWPALAVVAGHLVASALGMEDPKVASLRAAVGFLTVVGGALVIAPALCLIFMWTTRIAHEEEDPRRAISVGMGVVWPVWAAGIILFLPPVLGLGPELGELSWAIVAALLGVRIIKKEAPGALGIRRRWTTRFILHTSLLFVPLFALVTICPATVARGLLGAETPVVRVVPDSPALPLPPPPNW